MIVVKNYWVHSDWFVLDWVGLEIGFGLVAVDAVQAVVDLVEEYDGAVVVVVVVVAGDVHRVHPISMRQNLADTEKKKVIET